MGIKTFFRSLFRYLPQHGELHQSGYKARIMNGNMFFQKDFPLFSIFIYQGIEPHHRDFANLIDFEVADACIVVHLHDRLKISGQKIDQSLELFDYAYDRGEYLFCMNKKMTIDNPRIGSLVLSVERNLL